MSLDPILLGLLREPATGYELGRLFNESVRHFWFAERSQIYPALKRLEGAGLLESWSAPSERGPARRVYRTTREGHRVLIDWLGSEPDLGRSRLPYLAQLFFMDELNDPDMTLRFIGSLRDAWRELLARYEGFERAFHEEAGDVAAFDTQHLYQYATLRSGILKTQACLAWCEEISAYIKARVVTAPHQPVASTARA